MSCTQTDSIPDVVAAHNSDEPAAVGFDEHLEDGFEGLDWARLPQYMKPMASQRQKKSWIYRYGYRVALRKDPSRLYFI
jgi:hypothetical protein